MLLCVDVSQRAQGGLPGFEKTLDRHHGKRFARRFNGLFEDFVEPLKVACFMDLTHFHGRSE